MTVEPRIGSKRMVDVVDHHLRTLISLDPTSRARAIVDGFNATQHVPTRHIPLRSVADLPAALSARSGRSPASTVLILVNVDELEAPDLELIHSSVDGDCQVVGLHRGELSRNRTEWILRSGGILDVLDGLRRR